MFTTFCINLKELIITDKYSIFIIFVTNNKQLPKTYTNIQSSIRKQKFVMPSFPLHFIHVTTYVNSQKR